MFCDFILKYNTSYTWLENTNPVALYYERKAKLRNLKEKLKEGASKEKEEFQFLSNLLEQFNLSKLDEGFIYEPCNIKDSIKFDYENIQFKSSSVKAKNRYVENLYIMRNKLTHEGHLHTLSRMASKSKKTSPVFMSLKHLTLDHAEEVSAVCWEFVIPFEFLRALAIECTSNFLQERKKESRDPFENYINKHRSESDIRLSMT